MDRTELYCSIDDFWKSFKEEWDKHLINSSKTKRGPEPELTISEMMTIIILFHQSNFRTFKYYYNFVSSYLTAVPAEAGTAAILRKQMS